MKKLKIIMLFILILSPSIASAKMIDFGNDTYVNSDYIVVIREEKGGCAIYLGMEPQSARGITGKYIFKMNCKDFMESAEIKSFK